MRISSLFARCASQLLFGRGTPGSTVVAIAALATTILVGAPASAQTTYYTNQVQGGSNTNNWTTAGLWNTNAAGTGGTAYTMLTPDPNNFVIVAGGIVRSSSLNSFAGNSLTINGSGVNNVNGTGLGQLRFKDGSLAGNQTINFNSNFSGAGTGLIMNGGILDPGDDVEFTLKGNLTDIANSLIDLGNGGVGAGRGVDLEMSVSGSSMISLVSNNTGAVVSNVLVVGNNGGAATSTFSGIWNIEAYGLTVNGANVLGTSGGLGVATVNLYSGTTFNLNGSTLASGLVVSGGSQEIAGLTSQTAGSGTVNFGATTNTLTFNNTTSGDVYSGTITGSGILAMNGTGTQSFSGVNTYTGGTNVNGGTLRLTGAGTINSSSLITINGSTAKFLQTSTAAVTPAITLTKGVLDGTGTVGAVTVGAGTGGIVQNGNGGATALTLGSLTFSGAGTANLFLAGGATTAPALVVTGALSNSVGPVALEATPLSTWTNGTTYNLIQYGSFSGSLANFTTAGTIAGLTPRQSAMLGTAGNDITLTITGDTPKWTGFDNTNWQVGTTGASDNWKLIAAATATNYIEGDAVLFDDSATGAASPGVVNINGANVSPTSTTFNNSSINYTIGSTGGFGIAAGTLLKYGSATATLSTANTYTGVTMINSGTLRVNGSLAAGSAVTVGGVSAPGVTGAPTLAGSGTVNGPVTLFAGGPGNVAGHLAPSGLTGSSGVTLNLGGALTINNGSDLDFNLNSSTSSGNDLVSITGSGAVNYGTGGVLNINAYNANNLALGTYTLISDASSTTPTGGTGWTIGTNNDTNSANHTYTISVVGKNLDLTVAAPLTWGGQNSSAWDTSTSNWFNPILTSMPFFNGATALFGNTRFSGGPAVTNNNITMSVAGGVSPAAVIFNNTSALPYTITSNDTTNLGITGSTGVTLAGTGIVTLAGPNTYTGTTQLNAGTLVIGNNNSIGSTGGTIAPLTFNGGTLQYAASSTNTDISGRSVTIGAGGGTIDVNGNNVSYANAIGNNGTGSLKLLNSGAGPAGAAAALTLLSGASTYTGGTSISGGTLIVSFSGSPTETTGTGSYLGLVPSAVAPANISLNGGTLEFTNTTGTPAITLSNNRGITLGSLGGTLESVMTPPTGFGNSGVVYGGIITGNGSLTILGNGTGLTTQGVVFFPTVAAATTGLWTYTGNTTINGATLSYPSGGSAAVNFLPATTVLNIINNGAFNLTNTGSAQTLAGLTGTGTVGNTNTGSATALTISPPAVGTSTFSGVIAGAFSFEGKNGISSMSVTLSGTGTQIFAGANAYYGGTTLKSGTLGIDSATAIGVPTTVVVNNVSTLFPDTFVINGGTIDNLTSPSTPITLSTNNTQTWGPATVGPTGSFSYGGTGSLNLGTGAVTIAGDTATPFTETITASAVNPGATLTVGGPIALASTVTTTNTLAVAGPGNVALGGAISNGTGVGASLALTMSGTGTLNLSGTNTYTGATAINSGTLILSGSGSINGTSGITINGPGAELLQNSSAGPTPAITLTQGTLSGSGLVGAATVGAGTGGIISNGSGAAGNTAPLSVSSLAFNGAATMNLNQAGGSATTAPSLIVNGALSNSADVVTVNVSSPTSAWINGDTYDLIQYGTFPVGTLAGNYNPGTIGGLSPRQMATLGIVGNDITLTITGDSPQWTGLDSTNWQVGATGGHSNWQLVSAMSATDYLQGDAVLFDDSATAAVTPGSVTINAANVSPTSTTFNTSIINYTVSTTNGFGIAGSGPLIKNGTARVVISTPNSYSGATSVNAGTLNLQNNNALGASSVVTVANGAVLQLQGGITIGNSPLTLNGSGLFANPAGALESVSGNNVYGGLITLGSFATIQADADSLALTNSGGIVGSGFGLTVQGAGNGSIAGGIAGAGTTLSINSTGTWSLPGISTYTGTTSFTAGVVNLSGTLGSGGGTAISSGATFNETSAGAITGASALTVNSGTTTFAGTNNYTGVTTVTNGVLNITGGTTNFNSVGTIDSTIGNTGSSIAVLEINGGTVNVLDTNVGLEVSTAPGSQGFIEMNSGKLSSTNRIRLGDITTGNLYAAFTLSGGTVTTSSSFAITNFPGEFAVFNQSAGSVTAATAANATFIGNGGGTGVMNLSGGTFTSTFGGVFVGGNAGTGTGTLNVSNTGLLTAGNAGVTLASVAGATGVVNLLGGGTIVTNKVVGAAGTSIFNFSGGTLKANAGSTGFMTGLTNAYVYGSGGTIDNGGNAITFAQAISAPTGNGVSAAGLMITGGSGYIDTPIVTLVGDGIGATAIATVSGGAVTGITITNPGVGYSTVPTFTLNGGGGTGASVATGSAQVVANTAGGLTFIDSGAAATTTLSGANTYTGPTVVSSGTLDLANSLALQNSTLTTGGVTFDASVLGNAFTFGGLSGSANLALTNTSNNGIALSVGNNNASTTYSGAFSGGGSLNKIGSGTLILSGANTYSGATTVTNGTLRLTTTSGSTNNIASSLTISLAAGTTLDASSLSGGGITLSAGAQAQNLNGAGTVLSLASSGATTAASGTSLSPGVGTTNTIGTIGTLTFGTFANGADGNLKINSGATLNFVLGTPGTNPTPGLGSLIAVNGNLTLPTSGLVNVNVINNNNQGGLGTLGSGFYELFSYTGSLTNSFNPAIFTQSSGVSTFVYSNQNNQIDVQITTTALTWTGQQGNTVNGNTQEAWDIGATANWANGSTTGQQYLDGAIVSFGDTQFSPGGPSITPSNQSIQIAAGGVRPLSPVAFTNSSVTYTFTSADSVGISGNTGLVMIGTGTVNLAGPNSFTGAVSIGSGVINISDPASLGSSSGVTLAGGALRIQGVTPTNAIPLIFNGPDVATGALVNVNGTNGYSGNVTVNAPSTIGVTAGALNLSGNVSGVGALTLVGSGSGQLTLSGSNASFSGGITVANGTLNINSATALGSGTLTLNDGTTFDNINNGVTALSANNPQVWNGSFTFNGTNSLNMGTGAVTLNASPTLTIPANTLTVGGPISGTNFGLTLAGGPTATLVLGGTSTFGNTTSTDATNDTILGGVLSISNGNNLGAAPTVVQPASIFINGGTLRITVGTGFEVATLSANRGITLGASGGTINIPVLGAGTFATNESSVSYAGVISGTAGGNLTITGGSGTNSGTTPYLFELGGLSTYNGNTTINNATVSVFNTGGAGPSNFLPTTTVLNLVNNAWFVLNNNITNQQVAGINGDSTTAIGSVNGTATNVCVVTSAPTDGNTYNYAGVIGSLTLLTKAGNAATTAVTIAGTGSGAQILSGTNTYAGVTTLTSGTLGIDNASAIGTGTLVINGGTIDNLTSPSTPITLSAHNNLETWGPAVAGPTGGFAFGGTGSLNLGTGTVSISGDGGTPFTETLTANAATPGATLTVGGPVALAATAAAADTLAIAGPGAVTFAGAIANGGAGGGTLGVTMSGTGTLTLSTTNTYTGPTTVNSGTLRVPLSGSLAAGSAVTVGGTSPTASGNPTLTGGGTINGSLRVVGSGLGNVAGHIAPSGFTGFSGTTLNLTNALTLNDGAVLDFNFNSLTGSGSDQINITGSGAASYGSGGVLNINAYNGSLASGMYVLVNNASSATASGGTGWTVGTNNDPLGPSGNDLHAYTIAIPAGSNNLDLTVNSTVIWNGASSVWNTSAGNWVTGNGTAFNYANGFAVQFGDTYPTSLSTSAPVGGTSVSIQNGGVSPANVTFTNATTSYAISNSGSGGIGGSAGITLGGAGSVTLNGANSFIGAVNVNAGQLILANAAALGNTSGVTVAGGAALQLQSGSGNSAAYGSTAGGSVRIPTSLAGSGAGGSGALVSINGVNTYSGVISIGGSGATIGSVSTSNGDGLTLTGGVNNNGNLLTFNGAGNIAVSTTGISGGGGLTYGGTGTLTLNTSNSYQGTTTINSGTVVIGNNNELGSPSAPLTFNGGALRYAPSSTSTDISSRNVSLNSGTATIDINGNNVTYGSAIGNGGSGGLTLINSGAAATLTLAGVNNYTGPTTVNGGTLQVTGSLAGGSAVTVGGANAAGSPTLGGFGTINGLVTVNSASGGAAGHLAPSGVSGITTQLNLAGGLSLSNGSVLDFNIVNLGDSDLVNVTGNLSLGAGILNINPFGGGGTLSPGNYPLIDYSGVLTNDNSALWAVGSGGNISQTYSFTNSPGTGPGGTNQFDLVVSSGSSSGTWSSNINTDFGTGTNWSSGSVPNTVGQVATFGTGTQTHITLSTNYIVGQLMFDSATHSYDVGFHGGGSLTLDNSTNSPNGAVVTLTSGTASSAIDTTLILADSTKTTAFNIASGATLNVSGSINDSSTVGRTGQQINLTGGGSLELDGVNGYTGGTTVTNGTLTVGSNNPAATVGSGPLAIGASGIVNSDSTSLAVGGLSGSGQLNVAGSTTLSVNQTGTGTFSGALALGGSSGLTVNSGTLKLSVASSTLVGGETANVASGATLQLTGSVSDLSNSDGSNPANVVTHGTVPFSTTDGALSVVGATSQTAGTVTGDLTTNGDGAQVYAGNTTVGDGASPASLTATQILQNTLTINANSTVTIAPSAGAGGGVVAAASTSSARSAAGAAAADSTGDAASDPFTAIQAAIASGSISSATGQRLENRIAAIERLATTDPGLDVSLLESRVLATLPSLSILPSTDASPLVDSSSDLLAADTSAIGTGSSGAGGSFAAAASFNGNPAAVPEPSTLLLAALGGIGLALAAGRRRCCRRFE